MARMSGSNRLARTRLIRNIPISQHLAKIKMSTFLDPDPIRRAAVSQALRFPLGRAAAMAVVMGGMAAWITAASAADPVNQPRSGRPNILMIAIDDLNDWVEPLGGHPQVKTPSIRRLAESGITFTNAHCQAPLCNPSRTSLMSGRRPTSTGVYGLSPWIRESSEFANIRMMPQHFHDHGYRTLIGGKIYHGGYGRGKNSQSECDVWGPNASVGARPDHKLIPPTPGGNHPLMDWGTFPHRDEDKGDWQVASWAVNQLESMPTAIDSQPFFLSVGFFLPHVPCYATQKWFDLYPDESMEMPATLAGDREDTPTSSWYIHWDLPEPRTSWLRENDQLRPLVRSYLACVSFVDSQVGRVLDALTEIAAGRQHDRGPVE